MSERNWNELLAAKQAKSQFACVGLDVAEDKIPDHFRGASMAGASGVADPMTRRPRQLEYAKEIVRATIDTGVVGCFKPNLAFWRRDEGKRQLRDLIEFINVLDPTIPVILDAKWGDIGSTNDPYVAELGEFYGADAVTVHGYMGMEAMKPFLDQGDKGVIVLVKTSNPGSAEMQNIKVRPWRHQPSGKLYPVPPFPDGSGGHYDQVTMPNYQYVAHRLANFWNGNGNVAAVVGATYADDELKVVREIVGDMPILLPGIGAQGGDLEAAVTNGVNGDDRGIIVNSSRGIIFASKGEDFATRAGEETRKLHDGITAALAA